MREKKAVRDFEVPKSKLKDLSRYVKSGVARDYRFTSWAEQYANLVLGNDCKGNKRIDDYG